MLEIACFNLSSAIAAAHAGADRIELCADYSAGGVTPTLSDLVAIRKATATPVNVMVRPRAGNFVYSEGEFSEMMQTIVDFKGAASGFVFGLLDAEDHVDEERNRKLVELAHPLPCTFHRAFDCVADVEEAAKAVVQCGFAAVLTSGGRADAVAGTETVAKLQREFGGRVAFIIGGGVRSKNIEDLRRATVVPWYHSAALTQPGETVDADEVKAMREILSRKEASQQKTSQ